ncbi:MAG: hypothetical protein NTX22_07490 [Ignavibacteriales bacterium]|nr:hypothetical protein [Ignavibacteriales bacterium]
MKKSIPKVIIVSIFDSPELHTSANIIDADGFITKSQIGEKLIPMIKKLFPKLNMNGTE